VSVTSSPCLSPCSFGGCVLSLDPLYSDADLAFDPALLGIWKPADANEAWECRKDDHGGYRVLYTDEQGRRGEFSAHLLAVQGERFLDLFPAPPPATLNSFYTDHWVAGHTFARVLGIGAELKLAVLDEEWLAERLARHPRELSHRTANGQLLITATAADLQHFLIANLGAAGAFRAAPALRRAS